MAFLRQTQAEVVLSDVLKRNVQTYLSDVTGEDGNTWRQAMRTPTGKVYNNFTTKQQIHLLRT